MLGTEITKALHESGEIQDITHLQDKLGTHRVVNVARGGTLDAHQVDAPRVT